MWRCLPFVAVAACGSPETIVDERGDLRAAVHKQIDRSSPSIDDAEAALAKLVARFPDGDREIYDQLAELYRARWELAKPHTVRVIESYLHNDACVRVSQDITFPDPVALRATLAKELERGRDLYRKACNFRYAFEASAWLGDAAGYEADITALHRERAKPTSCARGFVGPPTADHDTLGIELAFGSKTGDVAGAVDRMLARDLLSSTHLCRGAVARAYVADAAGDYTKARELYRTAPAKTTEVDDCFATAIARADAAAPIAHVTGKIALPPDTTVRLAFQAIPKPVPTQTPSIYGNGTSIRYPWPRRDQFYYVDAKIVAGRFDVKLPPGSWLPQIEIDPAGKWTLGTVDPCLTAITVDATTPEVTLPDLTFVLVP